MSDDKNEMMACEEACKGFVFFWFIMIFSTDIIVCQIVKNERDNRATVLAQLWWTNP